VSGFHGVEAMPSTLGYFLTPVTKYSPRSLTEYEHSTL
jgi:hypothetical protein